MNRPLNVLCISPRFAPTNEADTHRLRLLLRHATQAGWCPTVVAVAPECLSVKQDPWLLEGLPKDLAVHRVAIPRKAWGLSSVFARAWRPMDRKVREILGRGAFDLVFFSTNEFPLTYLAIGWKKDFGVPFCMDFQDPWVNDYYRAHPEVVPPGGRLKYALISQLHRFFERRVVREVSGLLAVSQGYLTALSKRHGESVATKPMLVRPFPAEPAEFDNLPTFRPNELNCWRYIGRGGEDMSFAAAAFFRAWARAVDQKLLRQEAIRFEALGTSYANAGAPTLEHHADGLSIRQQVMEHPARIPYSAVMGKLSASSALVVFGSNDASYTASKIYPYLLAGKPLLAIFHEQSSVVTLLRECAGGHLVTFDDATTLEVLADRIYDVWFSRCGYDHQVALDEKSFEPYLARRQAMDLQIWFNTMLTAHNTGSEMTR